MTFGEKVSTLMKEKKITQRKLAKMVGVTEVSISRYIHEGWLPRTAIVVNMARVLGVSTDYLLGVEDGDEQRDEDV